ncbi:hypothetical protein [Kitasatospora sp. NBC_01539]|uniref:hypothetical protein n=1 Tax=Kitasatospora sp. NBC_01539 TaxID=2903577 RepID=UPI0038600E1C
MFTVAGQQYTGQELLAKLGALAADKESGVVWHDGYVAALPELAEAGRTVFTSVDAVLLSLGGCLTGRSVYAYAYRAQVDLTARRILAGKPVFENTGRAKAYNKLNWAQQGQGDDAFLQLRNDRSPYDAVRELADNSGAWTLDCATFVQAVQLGAWAAAVGKETFDQSVKRPFNLKDHASTGLTHHKLWFRESQGSEYRLRTPATDRVKAQEPVADVNEQKLLRSAPPGSRVAFVNADPQSAGTDFERENTVKLPDGTYASHPFGILSAAAMKHALALQTVLRYGDEIDVTLKHAAAGKHQSITPDQALSAQTALDRLLAAGDRTALAAWIMEHRTWTENLLYDDLDEYVEDLLYLGEVEIYTITPETTDRK